MHLKEKKDTNLIMKLFLKAASCQRQASSPVECPVDNVPLLGSLGGIMTLSQPLRDLQLVLGQVLCQCCLLYLKTGGVPCLCKTR